MSKFQSNCKNIVKTSIKADKKSQNNFSNLLELITQFSDEQKCQKYLEEARWNGQIVCPHCKNDEKIYKFKNGKLYKCGKCRKQFSVRVGTIFEDSQLSLKKWFMAIYLITAHKKGISSLQLSKDIGVTQKTAWFMLHRIRHAIKAKSFDKPLLSNIVEVDETYVGGKHHGKRGRGSENKTPVMGIVERHGKIRTKKLDNVKKATLQNEILKNVDKEAVVMTDDWLGYNGLSKLFEHYVINHSKDVFVVDGIIHTNTIDGYWSLFKRGLLGIYHSISKKHLDRYCDEFEFRYNTRGNKDVERFASVFQMCNNKRIQYKQLIAK